MLSNILVFYLSNFSVVVLIRSSSGIIQYKPATTSGWSNIPEDLLCIIAHLLMKSGSIYDIAMLSAVCKTWRSSALLEYGKTLSALSLPHGHPKLLLPEKLLGTAGDPGDRDFIYCSTQLHFSLNLPELRGMRCCGSGNGWLVIVNDEHLNVSLFNPLTREQVRLPDHPMTVADDHPRGWMMKAVIVGNPCKSPDYTVLAIISGALWRVTRPLDATMWRFCYNRLYFIDLVNNGDTVYCISSDWRFMEAYSLERDAAWLALWETQIPSALDRYEHFETYCVQVFDKVYRIIRPLQLAGDPAPDNGSLIVCLLNERHQTLEEVKDLGDCCLFLGENSSMALSPVPKKSSFQKNCVYFTRSRMENEIGGYDLSVYNLKDGTYQYFSFEDAADYELGAPLWIVFNRRKAA